MSAILSLGMGYLIGCISPAAWVGKKKNINLKEEGTGNLGATNTAITVGRRAGIFVLFFDVLKSFFAARLAKILFPQLLMANFIAGLGVILGHCFPVFMHFQGGKGLAAFGGIIWEYNPLFFVIIVISGVTLATILNTGVAAPILGCFLFPILVWFHSHDLMTLLYALMVSGVIFALHWTNLIKSITHNDVISSKEFYENVLFKNRKK